MYMFRAARPFFFAFGFTLTIGRKPLFIYPLKTTNHTMLITGGASGIGLALARRFLALGNEVIVTGRDANKLERAKSEHPGLHTFACDLTDSVQLDALVLYLEQHHPRLNVLINNASVQYNYAFDAEPTAPYKVEYEVKANLLAPMKLTALLLPTLKANPAPAIVNVSSSLGFVPKASAPVYAATKAGIHLFTKTLRYQLPGVGVFEVIPPLVDTPMTTGRGRGKISPDELVDEFMAGWQRDRWEMRIGKARLLLVLHRWLPGLAERLMRGN